MSEVGGAHSRQAILSGPILPVLLQLSWPICVSSLMAQLIPVLTMFWMGRLVGTTGLAVASLFRPVDAVLGRLRDFVAEGAGVLVAQSVGRDDGAGAKAIANGLCLAFLLNAVVAVVATVFLSPLIELLGGTLPVKDDLRAYIVPWLLFQPVFGIGLVIYASVNSSGWTRFGMVRNVLALVFVIPLYPLCMSVLDMGAGGAMTAIGLSSLFVAWISWRAIRAERANLRLGAWPDLKGSFSFAVWRKITNIGLPPQLARAADFLAHIFLVRIVMKDGTAAVAAYGIALTLFLVGANFTLALARASGTMIAQNVGAGQGPRARAIVRTSMYVALLVAAISALACSFAEPLIRLMTDDAAVIAASDRAIDLLCLALPAVAAYQILLVTYTAVGKNKLASAHAIVFAAANVLLATWLPMSSFDAAIASTVIVAIARALLFATLYSGSFLSQLAR